jgi:simple sugar transport system permease protein
MSTAEQTSARRGALIGAAERFRRLMLRPEPTAGAAAIVMFIIFTALAPDLFPRQETFVSVAAVAAELGIVSIGVTLLMIGGHFDVSVGAILGLSSYAVVGLINDYGVPPFLAFIAALLFAIFLGTINGIILVRTRIHSFVVTLGTMLIYRGILVAWTGGFPISVDVPKEFAFLAAGTIPVAIPLIGGFRMSLIWLVIVVIVATFVLLRTRFGNWIQAAGQNPQAARNLGVPVDRATVALFAISGLGAGITGIIQVARFASVDALRGEGIELQAIAVTVIGGTLLSGGYGSAIGTMLGAIVFAMIQIGLVLAAAPGYYYRTITGFILVAAVVFNTAVGRRLASAAPLAGLRRGTETGPVVESAEIKEEATQSQ